MARHFGYNNGAVVKNKYNELKGAPREGGAAKKKKAEGEGERTGRPASARLARGAGTRACSGCHALAAALASRPWRRDVQASTQCRPACLRPQAHR